MAKSPSDFSCHSYELFVGQEKGNDDNNKEKMSIRSEGLESVSEMQRPTAPSAGTMASKVRKVSTVSMAIGMLLHAPFPRSKTHHDIHTYTLSRNHNFFINITRTLTTKKSFIQGAVYIPTYPSFIENDKMSSNHNRSRTTIYTCHNFVFLIPIEIIKRSSNSKRFV